MHAKCIIFSCVFGTIHANHEYARGKKKVEICTCRKSDKYIFIG